ncbi:conserved Plasmodium protein, unknown function [Plasmodium berghei]|uniref:Uncharacterized protein n=2 Tax=Plasmodium berghei TaxID=5821 RepID=A0A509AMW2_PLABA|nr:conserved Plasmodium protein, unknown function [Plasmodium berghei ANKA]CXI52437.1 conserved Plasmodium protein, unknown function [Plasmodium berghei]SCL94621.1 conserved Plasmodium protein, unknown function [Plasmodium berghei]SCM16067.1 conserved Plasmodium protein, unknown function [Plasmodium berghei]SCM17862.1 conserved Plasmodium protein, unknown function [Plasmodium berghei]SCN26167.1 conserved Plasmodium protein, unknown function [Plasmodium berghei]|eukprot:XP_034421991.1 conserved Plasmodium protein, unknown function [Plasmodium berghei ANKA]
MDKEQNDNVNDKEIQDFFKEIEHIVNDEDINNTEDITIEDSLKKTANELIEKKKKSVNLPIQSKINLFLEEINFINNCIDAYEQKKEKRQEKNENTSKEDDKELDDILKNVLYLELGLKEPENKDTEKLVLKINENLSKIKNKEFILATKISLDIRIEDYQKKEIREEYFSNKVNELFQETMNQLNIEENETDIVSEEACMDIIKRNSDDKRLKDKINDPTEVSKEESYNIKSGNMIAIPQSTSHKSSSKKSSNRKNKENEIESSNFFHKKKMKLMERWKKVAEESKLLDSYDSSS